MRKIAINNDRNKHIFQILREKRDRNIHLKGNLLSRIPKPVVLSHDWIKNNVKYQEPEFYSIFFDESENGPFEVPPGHTKTYDTKIIT